MKSFTPTEFRADSSKVYNEVMMNGCVSIDHRDRPKMVLITVDELNYRMIERTDRAIRQLKEK